MKLIFCEYCYDVFKLARELRRCECGRCVGRYDADGCCAVTNREGHALAIGNGSLYDAVFNDSMQFPYHHSKYNVPLKTFLAWVRPHDGPENPRSRIDPELKWRT